MVCDLVVIKLLRWELADAWAHTILNRQHCLLIPAVQQALEQRSAKIGLFSVVAEGRGG